MNLTELAPDILTLDPRVRRLAISGVTADSRQVRPGTLFAALPGSRVRGSAFIPEAVKAGAAVILVDETDEVPADVDVPVLRDADPQRRFARLVARFYGPQPETVVAVTGTNGKTSVAAFVRQIWQALGKDAASVGTVGVVARGIERYGNLTTPDPVTLHKTLGELSRDGIDHVALEASSHGLVQRRLDGLVLRAGGFTNITRDHLDYHGTFEAYLAAKMRLFDTVLEPGAGAVINLDDRHGESFAAAARINGLDLMTVGRDGKALRLLEIERDGLEQIVTVDFGKGATRARVPLVGAFQVSNALVAAGLAVATGAGWADALEAMGSLKGAAGRLELVAKAPTGAPIFVDYAHTPDALETALSTLRPYVRNRLVVVFGAGGDRDKGKRPLMGDAARRLADVAIVTDDNPRSEDPSVIRSEILVAVPGAREIADRAEAIRTAVAELKAGDVLLVAGKGHETGQIVGDQVLPFSDHDTVRGALPDAAAGEGGALWGRKAFLEALGGRAEGDIPAGIDGITIDSRTAAPGEAFFAIKGDRFDGHDFVTDALLNGAALAVVSREKRAALPKDVGPLVVVDDVLAALERLAVAARARSKAKIIAVTGSVGKTSTKEALRRTLGTSGTVHASVASFNNHWGVPLTLARLPADADFGVFEIGMNHAGEITPLTKMVRPHIAIITTVAPVHLEHFPNVEAIADAKAEIFAGLEPGGTALLNVANAHFERLAAAATAAGATIVRFGAKEGEARVVKCVLGAAHSAVTAEILGEPMTYKIGAPGRHLVDNSLAVLAAVKLAGGDVGRACLSFQDLEQPKGRGRRHQLTLAGGAATLIDESYNANPASMRAALRTLGLARPAPGGRRIAVLGDMLELGPRSEELHVALARLIARNDVARVFCSGKFMKALHEALPEDVRGAWAPASAGLLPALRSELRPGDVVMIKGSLGSRMGPLVEALIDAYGQPDPES